MSWNEYHSNSEQLANDAELAVKRCDYKRAIDLYKQAAIEESHALSEIDSTKPRTLGITVVSLVSLYYKAGELQIAKNVGEKWLNSERLPQFAVSQIKEIIGLIISNSDVEESVENQNATSKEFWKRNTNREAELGSTTIEQSEDNSHKVKKYLYSLSRIFSFGKIGYIVLLFSIFTCSIVGFFAGKSTWMQTARANDWRPASAQPLSLNKYSLVDRNANNKANLRLNILSSELKWELASAQEVDLNGNDENLGQYIKKLDFSNAKAIICVGMASSTRVSGRQQEYLSNESLSNARAMTLVNIVRNQLNSPIPVYGLNLGEYQGKEDSSPNSLDTGNQRRVIIIEIAEQDENINLADAIHNVLSRKSNPFSPLNIDNYSKFQLTTY